MSPEILEILDKMRILLATLERENQADLECQKEGISASPDSPYLPSTCIPRAFQEVG